MTLVAPFLLLCGLGLGPITLTHNQAPYPVHESSLEWCEWISTNHRACVQPVGPEDAGPGCRTVSIPWDWACSPAAKETGNILAWYEDHTTNHTKLAVFDYHASACETRILSTRKSRLSVSGYSPMFFFVVVPLATVILSWTPVNYIVQKCIREKRNTQTVVIPADEMGHLLAQSDSADEEEETAEQALVRRLAATLQRTASDRGPIMMGEDV